MKSLLVCFVLWLAAISIFHPVVASEPEVYICGWHDYGYDCLLIIDYEEINYDEINYDI